MSAATPQRRDLAGAGLILTAAAFFATLGPLSEFADRGGVASLTLVTWRAALGATCVLLFVAARRAVGRPSGIVPLSTIPTQDRWFVAAAAVANTILNLSVFVAFQLVGITLSLLVFYLYPAFVAMVSVAWLGERLDRIRWGALVMSLVGSVLVVAGAGRFGELNGLGIGLALLGALGQTFYVISARHGFARVPGAQAAILTMAGAASLYVVLALLFAGAGTLLQPLAGFTSLWPVLLAGVIGAGVPTFLYIVGIRRLGAPRAAILATFEPVVGVALAALLLAERPGPLQLLGGLLIIGAGIVLQLRPNADVADHEAVRGEEEEVRP
ncbi:MAG TPA: DMT family transporter [Candidatus Limnocylindrales bacterium]|nr:DMT family transporter [Candidatus Limnocylindrales bacterium]